MLTKQDAQKIEAGTLTLGDLARLESTPATKEVGYQLRVQMHSMNPRLRHPVVQQAVDAALGDSRKVAVKALIKASRDMLTVWEGVAHPSLAYREGSPAWRIRHALEELEGV